MRCLSISVIVTLGLISIGGRALAQPTNTAPMPNFPPVGIGTQQSGGAKNALHIHFNPSDMNSDTAMIRFSEGSSTSSVDFGLLGLMYYYPDTMFSSLSRGDDLILHDHQDGDIIITNFSHQAPSHTLGGAIRFSTTGDTLARPAIIPNNRYDLERETILGNGNIGFDLAPDSTGLCTPKDQVQIGGGSVAPSGYTAPIPGLTIYGGNRFEGLVNPETLQPFSVDYRGIYFNHYENHATGVTTRFTPIGSCGLAFADVNGGQLNLTCWPPNRAAPLADSIGSVTLNLTGNIGLEMWTDERLNGGSRYHHLFNVWRPGYGGGDSIRNVNGLFLHLTPVLIDSNADATNFTDLASVHPTLGDGMTWMLAVNGPALFKEAFVSLDWPDYVFDPSYKLPAIGEVEAFYKTNRHLPDIPSARTMAETGVPLGKTEAAIAKQLEEAMLYITQLNHKIEALESKVEVLEKQKER